MNMKDNKFESCIGVVVLGALVLLIGAIVYGFVVAKLWIWFVVPVFDIRPISIPEAIGLSLLIGKLAGKKDSDIDDYDGSTGEKLVYYFLLIVVSGLFTLGLGWIIYQLT